MMSLAAFAITLLTTELTAIGWYLHRKRVEENGWRRNGWRECDDRLTTGFGVGYCQAVLDNDRGMCPHYAQGWAERLGDHEDD